MSIGNRPNDYVGQDIHDRNGQTLGTTGDVLIGPTALPWLCCSMSGGFIGDKDIVVLFVSPSAGPAGQYAVS